MSWFSRFNKKKLDPIDFSAISVDIHSHLIPYIDDGAEDYDESIDLIRSFKEIGFSKIVTTPHVMSDCYPNDTDSILSGLVNLKKELEKENIDVDISAAAEYYVDFEFQKQIKNKNFLVFGDNYILIEFPFVGVPNEINEIIFNLQLQGYNVILAHPERYMYYDVKDLQNLKERGVSLQINLLSLIGYYSSEVKNNAARLINKGLVDFVATDCHNRRHIEMLKKCFVNPLWHKLVESGKLKNSHL